MLVIHGLRITLNQPQQKLESVARKKKRPVSGNSLVILAGDLVPGYGGVAGSRYIHLGFHFELDLTAGMRALL
jgi:hypothetical protein